MIVRAHFSTLICVVLAAGQVSNLELRPGLLLLFVSLQVPPLMFDCDDEGNCEDDDKMFPLLDEPLMFDCNDYYQEEHSDDEVAPPPDKHGLSSLPQLNIKSS